MERLKRLKQLWMPFVHPMISTYASAAAFHLLLSALPASVLLISLLPYLSPLIFSSFKIIGASSPLLSQLLMFAAKATAARPSLTISASAVFTIWSASKGILALLDGINASMHTDRLTGFFRRRLTAMICFLFFAVALLISLMILVLGNTLLELLLQYELPSIKLISLILRFRGIVMLLLLGPSFTLMYRFFPSERHPLRLCLQSGCLAASAWVLSSIAFSVYVDIFSVLPKLYGSIGAVALTALWLRICVTVLLDGAVLIRARQEEQYAPFKILRSIFI